MRHRRFDSAAVDDRRRWLRRVRRRHLPPFRHGRPEEGFGAFDAADSTPDAPEPAADATPDEPAAAPASCGGRRRSVGGLRRAGAAGARRPRRSEAEAAATTMAPTIPTPLRRLRTDDGLCCV